MIAPLSPLGGWLADHYDRPKLLGITVVFTSVCILVTAGTSSYMVVLWMAVAQGVCNAQGNGASSALMADAVASGGDSSNAARDFTILLTLGPNLPGIVVPGLCGWLLTVFPEHELGYRVSWAVAGAFSLLSVPVLVCFVKPQPQAGGRR